MALVTVEYEGQEVKIKDIEFDLIYFVNKLNQVITKTWAEFLRGLNAVDAIVFAKQIISEFDNRKEVGN